MNKDQKSRIREVLIRNRTKFNPPLQDDELEFVNDYVINLPTVERIMVALQKFEKCRHF